MMRYWMIAVTVAALAGFPIGTFAAEETGAAEENEVTVTLDEVPAAVKAAIEKAAGSGKIGEIEKEQKDGKTVYEADITIDGKKYEVTISADGKLLKKELDDDAQAK